MRRILPLLSLCALLPLNQCAVQDPPAVSTPSPGIARDLAAERATSIRELEYRLHFDLRPSTERTRGSVEMRFTLLDPATVVLDFAGEELSELQVNDQPLQAVAAHNHLLIPKSATVAGPNKITARFRSKVAPTGTPLTVYTDKTTGHEYLYTLVVPADAHRLFPCFDQPDLKARFKLSLTIPKDWQASANGPETARKDGEDHAIVDFAQTPPLSTYLFAFAAGPFEVLEGPRIELEERRQVPSRLFLRKSKLEHLERDTIFAMHRDATVWLSKYFHYPYPFAKLDMVLLPGFPYGGMEHAGSIFYRESALVFEQPPTERELTRRSTLIYHEVSHQWFGNLVTMEWFDDLWLKEGFATFMGYTLFENLEPGKHAWLRFFHRVKPAAYGVDVTPGTTPVYQPLQNLANAKSAYGAIVYNKAPAILRELNHRLGPQVFQKGLQLFLQRYQFGNATWRDLVAALEETAARNQTHWSSRWILSAGMPKVQVDWQVADGRILDFAITQESVQGDAGTWPLQLDLLLLRQGQPARQERVVVDTARKTLPALLGTTAPDAVLLNPKDIAYGQFLLDGRSRRWLLRNLHEIEEPLVRAVAMGALWETVREAQLDPLDYIDCALLLLEKEDDAGTHDWLLGTLSTALLRYLPPARAEIRRRRLGAILRRQIGGDRPHLRTQALRELMATCNDPESLSVCQQVAAGEAPVAGMVIGKRDRFLAATALLGVGQGRAVLDALVRDLEGQDVAREAYIAGAAAPDQKTHYFETYLQLDEPPEQWMSLSLQSFHWPGQEARTLPYLEPALKRVEWCKKNRKIFFMPAWVDAFVNGHNSREALQIVESFLAEHPELSLDIRRKILQSLDGLRRSVRIRERWN